MDDTAPIEVTAAEAEAGTEAKPETAAPAPTETPAETPDAPAEAAPEEEAVPETPEQVGDKLHKMGAELTLRCVLSGILAVVLLHFGLVAAGLLAPIASLDPTVAPAAFYAANLLILAAALAVAYPVLRDGLSGLKKEKRPSADTMPALAACGAALEAVIALLNAQNYQNSRWTLLSGIAALGLFMALLGSRVMLAAVQNGYDLATKDPEGLQGALRVKDKDLIRVLARSLDQKDRGSCSAAPSSGTRRWWSRASASGPASAAPARQHTSCWVRRCSAAWCSCCSAAAQRHGCGHGRHALHGRPPLVHLGGGPCLPAAPEDRCRRRCCGARLGGH